MTWQIYITISIVFNSLATLASRTLMKDRKNDSYLFTITFQTVGAFLILLVGLALGRMHYPDLRSVLPNLVLLTFLYGSGSLLMFESMKKVEASNFTIIFATRAIFIILASRIFLGEILEFGQIVGALLVFLGVVIVSMKNSNFKFGRGGMTVLCVALLFGLGITNDKFILSKAEIDIFPFLVMGFFLPVIPMLILRPKTLKNVGELKEKHNLIYMSVFAILYVTQALAYYTAISMTNLGVVASVNQITDVLTVILAIIILHETDGIYRKMIGVVVSFIGLLLI